MLFSSALQAIKQPVIKFRAFYKTIIDTVKEGMVDEAYQIGRKFYKKRDYNRALQQFLRAAKKGHAEAMCSLGMMYYVGRGVQSDYSEAFKWCKKAAEQGDSYAQSLVGGMYEEGKGVPQDYVEAIKWFTKAAERGESYAQDKLGLIYAKGEYVP